MILIALDLDGTLEDSRDDMVAAVERVRAELGLADSLGLDLHAHVNRGMAHLYDVCFPEVEDKARVRRAYVESYGSHIADHTQLYGGIPEALAELETFGTLACVTNKPEALARRLLEALGISHRFGAVVGGDTCPVGKPDPVMLRTAAEHVGFNLSSGRCFMVGDTPGDIRLGQAYGATSVWCSWGYRDDAGGETPDLTARQPKDLPALLRDAV